MNTLQEQWISYSSAVIPKDASATQIRETKRAFYAGVNALFYLQTTMPDGISEDAEVAMMEGWAEELKLFVEGVSNGSHRY